MNRNRFFLFVIVCLVLSNIVALVLFFTHKPPHLRDDNRPRNLVIERLHFDQKQIEAYDILIKDHRKKIHRLDDQIRDAKKQLYGSLGENYSPKEKDSLIRVLNKLQFEIENVHVGHFLEIKALCKNEQLEDFDELSQEMSRIFRPKR